MKKAGHLGMCPAFELVPPPGIEPGSQPSEGRILSVEIQREARDYRRLRAWVGALAASIGHSAGRGGAAAMAGSSAAAVQAFRPRPRM